MNGKEKASVPSCISFPGFVPMDHPRFRLFDQDLANSRHRAKPLQGDGGREGVLSSSPAGIGIAIT